MWREHNYYVGSKESREFLLVHNTCPPKLIMQAIKEMDLRGFKINGKLKIPKNWLQKTSNSNDGFRYVHPTNPNIQIRVHEKGVNKLKSHNLDKPYMRYELGKDGSGNMRHADINGDMVPLNDPEYYEKTHIIIELITKFSE